ncbi:MAG: 16S rRNA (cytidine(1402)-2'-O)-methyltransferase [Actinomycetota bacterium]
MSTSMNPLSSNGILILAATPIGNVADASTRLAEVLAAADIVAAEDTRRLTRLTTVLGVEVTGRVVSYHEHNEVSRTDGVMEALRGGATVVVVTDAGMPSVSDPGYRLVAAAIAEGIQVSVIPGPSAVVAALAVSGLPVDRFCFEGFLPRKTGERARVLANVADERRTMVFFEAPHRLLATLTAMAEAFGAHRPAVVCRELTKTYEEIRRGPLADLVVWAASEMRGEITVVVAGAPTPDTPAMEVLVAEVQAQVHAGMRMKDAVAHVAADRGVSKRELYQRMVD